MGRTWQTKKKILELIAEAEKTPGELSEELGLAPSTITEHLESLERIGAISRVENPHVKKWKYYKANPDFNIDTIRSGGMVKINRAPQVAMGFAAAIVILALGFVALSGFQSGNLLVFRLTDPPHVPNGTQALIVTYSSLQAHVMGANNQSAWVSSNAGGTINLMTLINASQVIGSARVLANQTIDMVRFQITSARIEINNTMHNVTVPSGQITGHLTGNNRLSSNSSVLIDLTPTVVTIFTANSTVFILVPSVRAVLVGNVNASAHVGERHELRSDEREELNSTRSSIAVTSEFLISSKNTTKLSVTVKNNGNASVVIRHVILFGNTRVLASENDTFPINRSNVLRIHEQDRPPSQLNSEVVSNLSADVTLNKESGFAFDRNSQGFDGNSNNQGSVQSKDGNSNNQGSVQSKDGNSNNQGSVQSKSSSGIEINGIEIEVRGNASEVRGNLSGRTQAKEVRGNASEVRGNLSGRTQANVSQNRLSKHLKDLVKEGVEIKTFRNLNFIVTANGTLALPFATKDRLGADDVGSGYTLKPGASATFTFSGSIVLGDGHLLVRITPGSAYRLEVVGEEEAFASANVVATAS